MYADMQSRHINRMVVGAGTWGGGMNESVSMPGDKTTSSGLLEQNKHLCATEFQFNTGSQ